jgi:hypothetical protein
VAHGPLSVCVRTHASACSTMAQLHTTETYIHTTYSRVQSHGRVYYYNSGTGQSSWTPPTGSKVTSAGTHDDDTDNDDGSHSKHSTKHADSDSDSSSQDDDDDGPKHANNGGEKKLKRGRHVHKLTHYSARQAAKSLNSFLREFTHVCMCACVYVSSASFAY